MLRPELNIGDRVVLITMDGEPSLQLGDKGEVIGVSVVFGNKQYRVKWDRGMTLDLLEDVDKWMKEEDFMKKLKKKRVEESIIVTKKELLQSIGKR